MVITLEIDAGSASKTVYVKNTEYDVWKAIGSVLPNVVLDELSNGYIRAVIKEYDETVYLDVKQRGTFIKNGITYPSLFVFNTSNFSCLQTSHWTEYEECYLTCINLESNNYKFYHMKPGGNGINVSYGRIGATAGELFSERSISKPYPIYLYWIRYYEKFSKGYIDQSEIYLNSPVEPFKSNVKTNIKNPQNVLKTASVELYDRLYSCAKGLVKKTLANLVITKKQVEKSRYYFQQMGKRKTVRGFNNQLLNLMSVCPRKVKSVSSLLAETTEDFRDIIERE